MRNKERNDILARVILLMKTVPSISLFENIPVLVKKDCSYDVKAYINYGQDKIRNQLETL